MRLVSPRACESRACCSSGSGGRGRGGGGSGGGGGGGGPAGESTASALDVTWPDRGVTKPGLRSMACLGCVVTSRGGRDGLNLLGGVGVAVVMGVGGAEVGVGGSDSDERKQTPVLAEEDQEGSCFAGLSGFSIAASQTLKTSRGGNTREPSDIIRDNPASRGTETSAQRFLSVRPGGWLSKTPVHSSALVRIAKQTRGDYKDISNIASAHRAEMRLAAFAQTTITVQHDTYRLQPCDPKNLLSVAPPPGRSASVSASAGCRRAQRRTGTRR